MEPESYIKIVFKQTKLIFTVPWATVFSSDITSAVGMFSVATESFAGSTSPDASGSNVVFFFFFFFKLGSNIS